MYKCTVKKNRGIGEPSSKYGYDKDGKQFGADIQQQIDNSENLYAEFVEWMKTKAADPEKFRYLFMRYYEDFLEVNK